MRYGSIIGNAKLTILALVLIALGCFIYFSRGEKMTEKLAGTICAKLIYDYIEQDFKVINVSFNYSTRFNLSKIEMLIGYKNGAEYQSKCSYKKKYFNSVVELEKAILIGPAGKMVVFEDVKIDYKQ